MITHDFHPSILRAYDIRGIFGKTLFQEDAWRLGGKLSCYLRDNAHKSVKNSQHDLLIQEFSITQEKDPFPFVLGVVRDARMSSHALHEALIESLSLCGIHVMDFGIGPSPLAYYAAYHKPLHGIVMITASHNPKDDNGFKLLIYGESLSQETLIKLSAYPLPKELTHPQAATTQHGNILIDTTLHDAYGRFTTQCASTLKNIKKIAWDFSSGAMSVMAPWIAQHIPAEHIFLCDTLDGAFPHHDPDPTVPHNRRMIEHCVREHHCDLGFAFDGDGDRLVVIQSDGTAIDGDRLVALLASDVLRSHPGATILGDIKSSAVLSEAIHTMGGNPLLVRTGHSFIKAKMKETGALLAGEMSGHIFFADENKGYDDGLYAACRVLRFLDASSQTLTQLNQALPRYHTTPEISIPVSDETKFESIEILKHILKQHHISFNDLDGVRVDDERGWWLVRASNTQPILVVRLEGRTHSDLTSLKQECVRFLDLAHIGQSASCTF